MKRAILLAGIATLTAAMAPPFAKKVSDESLATMRGGFALPGGIEVALAVTTDTIVNGAIVLRSELRVATGPSEISVFVPRAGEAAMSTQATMSGGEGMSSAADMPSINYTPQEGISVIPRAPTFNVSIGARAPSAASDLPAGLEQIDLAPGEAANVAGGTVSLERMGLASRVRLEGDALATTHFYGDAIGSLTVNTGSGRTIDSITTINLDLANISPDVIGSSLFRAEAAALEATRMLSQ